MVIFSFCYQYQYGQFRITSDKDFKNYSDSLLRYAGISKPDFSQNDFEMRFWVTEYIGEAQALFVFNHNNNGCWNVKGFYFCTNDWVHFYRFKKDSFSLSEDWIKRWDSLNKSHILSLPTESKVFSNWKSSTGNIVVVADGISYRVELFTPKRNRRYSYSNPEDKLLTYDLNNRELVAINNIISILNNELKFKNIIERQCE